MNDVPRQPSEVPCPRCGHDLRGVPAVSQFYRCPECGSVSTLEALARTRAIRHLAVRRLVAGALLVIVLILLVMAATT